MGFRTDSFTRDTGQKAIGLALLQAGASFEAWQARLDPVAQAWLAATGSTGKAGGVVCVPDATGALAAAALIRTEHPATAVWDLARAAEALPAGLYRPDPAPLCPHVLVGWLLAASRLERPAPTLLIADPELAAKAQALAEAILFTRTLINQPANVLGPVALEAAVRELAQTYQADLEVLVGDALLAGNFPLIHAVGRAASEAPRLMDLHWGDPAHPKVTLVGKGVCFDSGGLNLKPGNSMALMKKDMGGAAIVLGLAQLIMTQKLPVRLRVLIPAVENAVSANAMRPGDIIPSRKGLTVEITNTDAEGRLILADALTYACEDAPELLLDVATLTGAARVALGPDLPALFTPHDALAEALLNAGIQVADPLWRLPLWPGYADMLESSGGGDLQNAADSPFAGASLGALFLERFVTPGIPWAHLDAYAWRPGNRPGQPKGGEATALRALWHWLQQRFDPRSKIRR